LKSLSKLVVGFADLLEAEGRALREHTRRTGTALAFTLVAAALVLLGLALILLGVYWSLEMATSPPIAALLCGLLSLIFAGAIAWLIIRPRR
jgi:hypothetical protein